MSGHLYSGRIDGRMKIMWDDPIVSEIRKIREDHAAKFNYDLRAIYLDMKKKEIESKKKGWKFVSLQPKKLKRRGESPKSTDRVRVADDGSATGIRSIQTA